MTDTSDSAREAASGFGVDAWRALGTYVQLVVADRRRLPAARVEAERLLVAVDQACSRFREDSDLCRANAGAGRWTAVHPLLATAVQVGLDAAQATGGLVDPTLGCSLVALGYDRDLDQVRSAAGPAAIPRPAVTDAWRQVGVDPAGGVFVPEGVALDLGATGKAFACDLITRAIATEVGTGCVVSLGGDVAVGVEGQEPIAWQIAISELPSDDPEEMVSIQRGGLATSSTTNRRWRRGDYVMHHLLDPRTGLPVECIWRTVSVAAGTCTAANTASTAAIILGSRAVDWLGQHDLAARLVDVDGRVTLAGGWPREDRSGSLP